MLKKIGGDWQQKKKKKQKTSKYLSKEGDLCNFSNLPRNVNFLILKNGSGCGTVTKENTKCVTNTCVFDSAIQALSVAVNEHTELGEMLKDFENSI